ncbi:Cytoskeletal-regulatory complex EF hand [Phytophthora infestans]|uniref:Cytoskeletal-regulatory complex EF hand n=1 Tax=Phytophthora infestans TaxID=4787 RepID=A0A833T268_PHYIN|nr:Cytoskeletal-regulatory complex EF hand [Phytophthora infestans]KAF4141365.1 Cytoskeletal-regulatory complex EF hand [Phytophthora infestans]
MNPQHYATYNPQQQQQQFYAGAGAYATQSGGMSAPSLHTWVPPSPQEQQYYDMLFAHVDDQRRNAINGQQAVAFFARSHVDKTILREVWSIADAQRRSELSRNEFYVAMRLISMAQRGEQVSVQRFFQMATMQYPLPAMDGVPPPQQQPIQPQAQMHAPQQDFGSVHQQATGSQPTGPYALTTDEKSKYSIVFQQYDTDHDGFLMGPEAVALFQMSGLDRNVLRDIWSMADVTQDSKLSVQEFYVAMHLIVCVSKRGLPMPSTLPRELGETAFGSSAAVPGHSNQMSAPSAQNGFPVQTQHESVPPPKPEGMSAFDSFATVEDTPLPTIASSTPRSNSFNHVDSNTTNSLTGGFSEPSVPTPTGGLQGLPAPASQDFGSFSATPAASVTSGRDRTNSASSMNSMSSFSGMAPLPPQPPVQQFPPRNFGCHERIQAQHSGFQAPQQTYPGFGAESFGSSAAAPEKPFMSDDEEKKVVGQLDQQNQQVIQALASVERKQTAIEMISEKLRDLDELRHELVTLVMKREDLRSASNSTFAAGDNAAEEHTRLAVEHSLRSLVENQKQLIQQLQCDVARHEGELEEAILSAKLQQKLSLESRSSLIDAASPTHDSDRAGGSKTFVPAPLSLDGSNALPSPVAAPSAPSVSAYSPDATDSSGFNAFSNFDSAPRSIASVTPSSTAGVPSGSPFSPTPSPSQNATASDSFTGFGDFVAPPSVDATSPLAATDVPGRSPFSLAPSPAAASDSAGFDAFGSAPVSADGPAPLSSPAPVEASPFSPFSPSPSPAATDDIGFNGFGDFNAALSFIPAATEAPGHSPFSPMASPAADTSVSTVFSASFDTPAKIDAPEGSPFSPSPSPAAAETPAFDAFAAAPLSNDSAATPASATAATENLIFSPVAANNSGSNTFGDFGAASHDAASSETTVKQESTGNLLFSSNPSPAAASTSSGLDAFGDFSAPPASTDSTASVLAPEKTMGNSPFFPVASDNNDFNGFGDFSAPPVHSATSSAPDKLTEASGSSVFSPVAKDNAGSGFEVFGDLNAAPASTDSAATPSDAPNSANVSGGSPFSPVANDNTGLGDFGGFNSAPAPTESTPETKSAEVSGHSLFSPVATDSGFGDFGDFNSAPVSADSAKPTATKELTDSNGFEAFEDFSAAPSAASADFGSFS